MKTVLTLANVNQGFFWKLFTILWMVTLMRPTADLTKRGHSRQGVHNVLYVATEHDSLYAFPMPIQIPAPTRRPFGKSASEPGGPGVTSVPNGDVGTG